MKKRILVYFTLGGFIAYLLIAILSAFFILPLELDQGWCLEFTTFEGRKSPESIERICTEFKNNFEEAKHLHNLDMLNRNSILHLGIFVSFFPISALFFYFIPKWKGNLKERDVNNIIAFTDTFGLLLLVNYIVVYIIPWILGYLLPPPVEWFPAIIIDMHNRLLEATYLETKDISLFL